MLTPGLLAVIFLDVKDDFYNDAEEVFRADVNQEPLLVREVLSLPAWQSFRGYWSQVLGYSTYLNIQIRIKDFFHAKDSIFKNPKANSTLIYFFLKN